MLYRTVKYSGIYHLAFITCLALSLTLPMHAQRRAPLAEVQFDPSDVYLQGYLASRSAEKFGEAGDHIKAAEQYRKADELFSTVRKYYPDWKAEMVQRRAGLTVDSLAMAQEKARAQLDENRSVVAELEGGQKVGGNVLPRTGNLTTPPKPNILEVDPILKRRLSEAEAEVDRLRRLTAQQKKQSAAQAEKLREQALRDRAKAEAEIKRLEAMTRNARADAEKRVKLLQDAAATAKANAATEVERIKQLTGQEKADAEQELAKLRNISDKATADANAEIQRLQQRSAESDAEAQKKIRQLQQLAAMARTNAAKEVERIKQLTGKEKEDAQAELARLRKVAARANADAEAEINRLQQLSASTEAETQRKIERLKQLAAKSKSEADAELERLRKLAAATKADAVANKQALNENQNRSQQRINNLTLAKNALQTKLETAEANVKQLRAKLARAPLQSEMESLNQQITKLEQERQAMAMALQQSRNGFSQATGRIGELETELKTAKQQIVNLNRDMERGQQIANNVVKGQRLQLEALSKELEAKSEQLAEANQTILGLKNELQQSRDAFSQLRTERDSLLVERDQMAALLKLNEGSRIQDLIEQNMSLAKKLRESKEKLERLYVESNGDKDRITEALRDLAIAKSQINSLRADKIDQEKRLAELEKKLQEESKALASGEANADPAEVAVLRDIIKRQLRVQKRRKQARELLINAVRDLSREDEQLAEAVKIFDAQEVALSPEELKLIADRQVDGEFVSPFARDRAKVDMATSVLEQDIAVFDRAAKKSFLAGRLLPTRELYEMILDQHPGHTPTLCKLGVVYLKLDDAQAATDSFRRAVELDTKNSYAYRMFGYSLMKLGDLDDAEGAVRESVQIDPNDGKAHMLLGTLCYRLGRRDEAESHFKGAINADPLPSEPYYNLAVIYSRTGRLEEAQNYYKKALKRGALPDAKLEDALTMQ